MDIQRLLSFFKQTGTIRGKGSVPAASAKVEKPPAPMKDVATGIDNKTAEKPSVPISLTRGMDLAVLRKQMQILLNTGDGGVDADGNEIPHAVKTALSNLTKALDPVLPEGDTAKVAGRIRGFVENSGLYFEKRLEKAIGRSSGDSPESMKPENSARQPGIRHIMAKDLKPNLLILKQFLDESDQKMPSFQGQPLETMKKVVSKMLVDIEQQQHSATQRPSRPELLQAFTHMMVPADDHQDARLKIYYERKGRRGNHEKQPRISLLLEMDRMGMVRADLWTVEGNLNITFFIQDEKTKRAFEKEKKSIGEMLADTFSTVSISIVVNEKKIAEFDGEDLTQYDNRQLDVTV